MIQELLTYLFVTFTGVCVLAWIVALMHESGFCPMQDLIMFFKRQSKVGRILFGTFFAALWLFAGTKPDGRDGSSDVGTAICFDSEDMDDTKTVYDFADVRTTAYGDRRELQGEIRTLNGCAGVSAVVMDEWSDFVPITSTNTARMLQGDDFRRGFVLTRTGMGERHDFSAPPNAVVCDDWRAFGASEDWMYLAFDDWSFQFGTDSVNRFRVFSFGKIELCATNRVGVLDQNRWLAPFRAELGIVPQANWPFAVGNENATAEDFLPSQFWHFVTPSNTLQFTWQNVFLGRLTNAPINVQMELWPSGKFIYRYDLSRLNCEIVSNVIVGASLSYQSWITNSLPTNTTSLVFHMLTEEDSIVADKDGDGLATIDEIYVYGTNPDADDTDMDGIADGDELFVYGTDPLDVHTISMLCPDGMAIVLNQEDPWSCPEGSTNTIWEHIFYTGTTNGAFAYPESTMECAVIEVKVSGYGTGELMVGDVMVPLLAPQASHRTAEMASSRMSPSLPSSILRVSVRKGVTHPVHLNVSEGLSVSISSDDFAFGRLPSVSAGRFWGRINFPNTVASEPCIHDLYACRKRVSLPVGEDAGQLSCTWSGDTDVEIISEPPCAATLTGMFSPKYTSGITYTLSHPEYLFGKRDYRQIVCFCPKLSEDEEEPEPFFTISFNGDGCGCGCEVSCDGGCGCQYQCHRRDVSESTGCSEHSVPFVDCAHLHATDISAASTLPRMAGILPLRNPTHYAAMLLDVPSGLRSKCCPCPEHAENLVETAYASPRLSVLSASGDEFLRSTETCAVGIGGVSPSEQFGDAHLIFATNGATSLHLQYTVVGVGISHDEFDLAGLNALAPDFGMPIAVGTNDSPMILDLDLDVRILDGRVRISLDDATAHFRIMYEDGCTGRWRMLVDSVSRPAVDMPVEEWRRMFGRSSGDSFSASVAVVAYSAGRCDITFRYWAVSDGAYVDDVAVQRVTAVNVPLLPDMDGDGRIGAQDADAVASGRLFRYWTNEDIDKGDFIGQVSEISPNSADFKVNGRLDLVNLFPVSLDLKSFVNAWGAAAKFFLIAPSGCLKFCAADIAPSSVGMIQTADVRSHDGIPLHSANLIEVSETGVRLDPADHLRAGNAPGVLAFEAARPVLDADRVELRVDIHDKTVFTYVMPVRIASVSEMYRWMNLRGICNGGRELSRLATPSNLPDEETDWKHFVFVHGYGVSVSGARRWADSIFKRLWLSGARSMFTAVDWRGDESRIWDGIPASGGKALDYYVNVCNAFASARTLSEGCAALPGVKVLLAHSLGNVLVSSAIKDHNLDSYSKYYMLNAAVPMEAYDPDIRAEEMIEHGWRDVAPSKWAANWSALFRTEDVRSTLSWRGRFTGIRNIVNCYSSTEDILANATMNGWGGAWGAQELFKGTAALHLVPGNCEGGWGYNWKHCGILGMLTDFAKTNMFTASELIAEPLFRKFDCDALHSTNVAVITRSELDKVISDGIPATSFAAGANAIGTNIFEDFNYQGLSYPNGWPRKDGDWLHSDVHDIAYFYIHDFFEKLAK